MTTAVATETPATETPAATTATTPTPPAEAPATTTPAAVTTPAATTTPAPAQDGTTTATAPTAPDTYDLTVPEGLDDADLAQVTAIAKAKGWTNEQAQQVFTDHATELAGQRTRLRSELEAHPTLGGAHLAETDLDVRRALDHYLPETDTDGKTLRGFLAKTGYGNSPAFVGFLARLGRDLKEDNPVRGGGPPAGAATDAMGRLGASLVPTPKG